MIALKKLQAGATLVIALSATSCLPEGAKEHADADNDGQLETKELEAALSETIHTAGDADGDGHLTVEEWTKVYPEVDKSAFAKYDKDGTPGLSVEETVVALDDQGSFDSLIFKIDANNDGVIDEKEAGETYEALQSSGDNLKEFLK
ncbi:MAG: hypothetical protein AAGD22_17785 [Verrucomicrobiota bacterium]